MTKIDHKTETLYLEFVQKNITLREKKLETERESVSGAVADGKSQHALREFFKNAQVPDPDNPYFVRIDLSNGDIRYYGHIKLNRVSNSVPESHEAVGNLLILSSKSDGKGYTADYPENLPDLVARTRFMILQGKIVKISEEFFDGSREEHSVIAAEIVTESIEQTRKKKMQPISSTLQPDQFSITREPISHSLAIQGPPGSGKTAVLLERLARVAFADEAVSRKGMLLIGPNKPFMEYVSQVLPTLGENDVALRSIDELSEISNKVNSQTIESESLIYLKGSVHMKRICENLVEKSAKVIPKSTYMKILDIPVEFTTADSYRMIQSIEDGDYHTFSQKRKAAEARVRTLLVERFQEEWLAKRGSLRNLQGDPAQLINQESAFRTIIRNMYPNIEPAGLLGKLKSDASFFMEHAEKALDTEDLLIWLEESEIQAAKITPSDIPILDYLDFLLNDPVRSWGHIAVDETQDMTEMQLAMISRRLDKSGSLSLAGDLAQATGAQYYENWSDILGLLEKEYEYTQKYLSRSYRVPSDILEYAQQFLDASRVNVSPSLPFLQRENSLEFVIRENSNAQVREAVERSRVHVQNNESVLILSSAKDREIIGKVIFSDNNNAHVRVMDPTLVKGLEFDVVIIVNPAEIIAEHPWHKSRLARLLYVLTTRSTKKLTLIGPELRALERPLDHIEDDEEEDLENQVLYEYSDEVAVELLESTIYTLEGSKDHRIKVALPPANGTLPRLSLISSTEALKAETDRPQGDNSIKNVSILDRCRELNIDIRQGSGEYLSGYWIFAGMTQIRCTECSEKPQMLFLKHVTSDFLNDNSKHYFTLVCQGCSVIRDYDASKHGPLEVIFEELKINQLIEKDCHSCGG